MIKQSHPSITSNDFPIKNTSFEKHLGLTVDDKLNFNIHLKWKSAQFNKVIEVLKKLRSFMTRQVFSKICRCFIPFYLTYIDVIYEHPENGSFYQKLEYQQCNAAHSITEVIKRCF